MSAPDTTRPEPGRAQHKITDDAFYAKLAARLAEVRARKAAKPKAAS